MTTANNPPDQETLRELDAQWPALKPELFVAARRRCRSAAEARDMVSRAYLDIRSGKRRWGGKAQCSFRALAFGVVRSITSNQLAVDEAHPEDAYDDDAPFVSTENAEQILIARQADDRVGFLERRLHEAIAGDPQLLRLLSLALDDDVTDPEEQALRMGMPLSELRNLRKRLRYQADRVVDAWRSPMYRHSGEGPPHIVPKAFDPAVSAAWTDSPEELTKHEIARELIAGGFDVERDPDLAAIGRPRVRLRRAKQALAIVIVLGCVGAGYAICGSAGERPAGEVVPRSSNSK
jgi:DNA-directed RNA polymerase specialized sigma24 family protein